MKASIDTVQQLFQTVSSPVSRPGGDGLAEGTPSFAGFLQNAARDMDQLRAEANQKVSSLISGNGTDVHTALIATQKADLAFDLALATRNKAISAYQQLMSTQF